MSNEVLDNYWVSDARWEGDGLVATLSPVPKPKYTIKVSDVYSIARIFDLMRDRDKPVRSFEINETVLCDKDNTDVYAYIDCIKNEGR